MKEMTLEEREAKFVPRVCIFGGKAFATYIQAKRIVKFITDVGATVNNDPDIGDLLKVYCGRRTISSIVLLPGKCLQLQKPKLALSFIGTSGFKTSFCYR